MRKADYTKAEIGGAELTHLFEGDCLLGGGCRVCDQVGEGPSSPRILRVDFVRELWAVRKKELTAAWMAKLEAREEPGPHHPWFVEVVCEGARFPPDNHKWPAAVKERHARIASNLAVLHDWRGRL